MTSLKSSRSSDNTATDCLLSRRCNANACSSRSWKSARLASPVSGSLIACAATAASSLRFSATTMNWRSNTSMISSTEAISAGGIPGVVPNRTTAAPMAITMGT